jgi:hypothetical protein
MTVGQLKTAITDYLQITFRPSSEADNDAGILSKGDSLALISLNNARKTAERIHDFLCADDRAVLSVSSAGSNLSGALKWVPGGTPVDAISVKSIKGGWLSDSSGNPSVAVNVISSSRMWTEMNEQRSAGSIDRYPSDPVEDGMIYESYLYFLGEVVGLHPVPTDTTDVILDISKWMDDYVADGDTDWFTIHASDYLMWAGIVEVNHIFQTFVPRQEGSLAPPTASRDRALQQLIAFDSYRREQGQISDQY